MKKKKDNNSSLRITNTRESQLRKMKSKIVVGAITFVLLTVTGLSYYISNQETVEVDKSSKVVKTEKNNKDNKKNKIKLNNDSDQYSVPIELEDWQKNFYRNAIEEEDRMRQNLISSLDDSNFFYMTNDFPSTQDGFTDNPEQMYDEEGFPNIYYTNILKENFKFYTIQYLNRLFNPVFGGWTNYQFGEDFNPNEIPKELYSDMFTDNYLRSNENNLPFYTDKNKDNFGYDWGEEKGYYPRFTGIINEITDIDTDEEFKEIKIKADIRVFGKPKGKLIEKKYLVNLKLVYDETKENKIVINDIEIKDK